jgi:hypothetical protein
MILGLGLFALVYGASFGAVDTMLDPVAGPSESSALSGQAATGATYAAQAHRYLPFFAIAAAAVALIAGSVAERRIR